MPGGRLNELRFGGAEFALRSLACGGISVLDRSGIAPFEDGNHLAAGDRFLFEKVGDDLVHILAVLPDDPDSLLVAPVKDRFDLLIHERGGILRAVETVAAVKILIAHAAERHHAERIAHAEHGDHVARDAGGLLNILRRAVGHRVHHDLLRGTTAHGDGDLRHQLILGAQVRLVLLRHEQRVAEAALRVRDDGDLLHRLGVFLLIGDHGVTDLVVGDELLFKLGEYAVFLFTAGDDELKRGKHVLLRHEAATLSHGAQRRFVGEIGKIGAHTARGGKGDLPEVDVLGELDVSRMHLKRSQTAREVGTVDRDAAVKAPGTQQRLVEHLGTVGGGENDDALAGVKAVHLGKELVERLLALIVAAEASAVARFADGVDLIDEDDARRDLAGFAEQVTHAACTHAHKHFHKVGAGDGEKRHVRLTGDRLGKQRLARTG